MTEHETTAADTASDSMRWRPWRHAYFVERVMEPLTWDEFRTAHPDEFGCECECCRSHPKREGAA